MVLDSTEVMRKYTEVCIFTFRRFMVPMLKTTETENGEMHVLKLFRLISVFSPFPPLSCLSVAQVRVRNPRLF